MTTAAASTGQRIPDDRPGVVIRGLHGAAVGAGQFGNHLLGETHLFLVAVDHAGSVVIRKHCLLLVRGDKRHALTCAPRCRAYQVYRYRSATAICFTAGIVPTTRGKGPRHRGCRKWLNKPGMSIWHSGLKSWCARNSTGCAFQTRGLWPTCGNIHRLHPRHPPVSHERLASVTGRTTAHRGHG